ncbi:TPA: hypothetical protein I8220_003590 [Aeromonas hydrophila]|uniref:hypothetical protein n=1 Tax=Aeromonas hydrophila TaxID=644 RepID=UPI0013B38027|nr:hypothetical protein [Aeromonas hydrophila]HAT2491957.1 hypothetical protein [Aeromonas hydrophila]HAT2496703.1 hypothetical protein [Aeromonas hydrophila]HAT2512095.1 hypothetical protein [Aeromonas hydrophila]HAT2532587.1 hypothetical protein [Aeromonas hydrophila]
MMIKKISMLLAVISATSANALTVDTMFLLSDSSGNGVVTLTNDLDKTSFIKTSINEIHADEKGEVFRVPYTKDNIKNWRVMTTNPKLILEPGRAKDVGIRSLCHKTKCESDKDMTFSVVFEPAPYLKKGEEQENAVQVNYGYSVIYVVPAIKSDMKYSIKRQGRSVEIFNQGNTMLTFVIDRCKTDKVTNCRAQERVISGRFKRLELPEYMQSLTINAMIYNHDESYKREIVLGPDAKI